MKDLPKKKTVEKLEEEDEFLAEYPLKNEKKFFDKGESRLKRLLRVTRISKPRIKKVKEEVKKTKSKTKSMPKNKNNKKTKKKAVKKTVKSR